jgi:non-ribosomal peptide synthetase component E (peptide arylation enzyme)
LSEEYLSLKKNIVEATQKGTFRHNPLLSTIHNVTCSNCRFSHQIVYLNYLKTGKFNISKPEHITVLSSFGIIDLSETQKVTPIVIHLICEKINNQIVLQPVTVEYLTAIIKQPSTLRALYA